jgi:type IV pilus assembly protein PilA
VPFIGGRANGFTLIEVLVVAAVISALAAIALPGLLRARRASRESAAIASMRSINSAEATYASSCAKGGYAQALEDLAKPATGGIQLFISPDIAADGTIKSGFVFNLDADQSAATVLPAGETCNAASHDAVSAYFAEAHPASVDVAGQRSFALDARGILYFAFDGHTIAPGMTGAEPLR